MESVHKQFFFTSWDASKKMNERTSVTNVTRFPIEQN